MLDDFKLAWRNVWRNTRRSLATMAAMGIGLFVIVLYSGLVTGYLNGLETGALDLGIGDGQVHADGYREKPSLYLSIAGGAELVEALEAEGFEAAPRLLGVGLGAGEDNSSGVRIVGIDVEADADIGEVQERVASGTWLSPDDRGVVLGRRVAENLHLEVGGELVILSQGADGSMANDLYEVRGVLGPVNEGIDRGGVFMTEAAFRELMVFPEGFHEIIFRIPAGAELEAATSRAASKAAEGVEVASWRTLNPGLSSMLQSAEGAMAVMMGIIYIAVGIVVLNAMLMAVFERIREFGVLKAIGFGPAKVFRLIMLETAIQAMFAVGTAIVLSLPANYYLSTVGIDMRNFGNMSVMGVAFDPIWKSIVSVDTYLRPTLSLLVIIGLSVLYPAARAALLRPLDAIRHQ